MTAPIHTHAGRIARIFQSRGSATRHDPAGSRPHTADAHALLMPFITAGYPDMETTVQLLPALEKAGASICEIGIPFSDPIADGPVISSSMHEALQRGFRLEALFEAVSALRSHTRMGLVAMVSCSIVQRIGVEAFAQRCAEAGFDGLIVPDLPLEESREARSAARHAGLTCTLLVAPTTPTQRARLIAQACTGFVYLLTRTGITGERGEMPNIGPRVAALRAVVATPIACGFGIATAEHVRTVVRHADAAIVGSAIVRRMQEMRDAPREELVAAVAAFVVELAQGLQK